MNKALAINMAILFAFTITSATFAGEEKLVPPVYNGDEGSSCQVSGKGKDTNR